MISRASHLTIYVTDHEKAYNVYVNKLGCKVNTDFTMDNGFRWLTVTLPDQPELEIVLSVAAPPMFNEEMTAHMQALLGANALGSCVFATDDCQKSYEEMKAKGIEFTKEPTKEFYGIEATFRDGCGNWFSLTQRSTEDTLS